jgi:hypothetical protein
MWRAKNPERRKELSRRCYKKHAKKRAAEKRAKRRANPKRAKRIAHKWYWKNLEKCRYQARRGAWRNRRAVLKVYGSVCVWCKDGDERGISIDHKKNDGAAHRRKHKIQGGSRFYCWLRKNKFPKKGFQSLCMTCQLIKQKNGGVLPLDRKDRCKDLPVIKEVFRENRG